MANKAFCKNINLPAGAKTIYHSLTPTQSQNSDADYGEYHQRHGFASPGLGFLADLLSTGISAAVRWFGDSMVAIRALDAPSVGWN